MGISDKYTSSPIPSRDAPAQEQASRQANTETAARLNADPFVEVAVHENSRRQGAAPAPIVIDSAEERQRVRFYEMRQIAYDQFSFDSDFTRAKVFYRQAKFMEDYQDDFSGWVNFSSFYPYYQKMGHRQLRTYFTWRSLVRRGTVEEVSLSYAFLYIYELLNNIGVENSAEGLQKLLFFWRAFREFDQKLDAYVPAWLKDYHVYYPLEHSFRDFVEEEELEMYYPTLFSAEADSENNFAVFSGIAKYKIQKSIFYNEETAQCIAGCFCYILEQLRQQLAEKGQTFESLLFYPMPKTSAWTPFSKAIFYPAGRHPDRQVVLSDREAYACRNQQWSFHTAILSENGKALVGYMMKEMEASLRERQKFRYKLVAKPEICDERTRSALVKCGILFPAFIRKCVSDYFAQINRREVTVNAENLRQIRREALRTQEKLIVPEETALVQESPKKEAEKKEAVFTQEIPRGTRPIPRQPQKDIWERMRECLTENEMEALKIALAGGNIKAFALQSGTMLEVLLDGINDKAMDCIGDAVLELEDEAVIYDEYREKLMEMVNH